MWFLEMSTCLAVEHPVTEAITGLDLVRLQIAIAEGEPLPFTQDEVRFEGHAIEVRLNAEDPADGWVPSLGLLHRWRHGPTPGIRYDDAVVTGTSLSPHYDSLLSKLTAHAVDRDEAAARLGRGLRELHVHGPRTNRDYLLELLESDAFRARRRDHRAVESTHRPPRRRSGPLRAGVAALQRHRRSAPRRRRARRPQPPRAAQRRVPFVPTAGATSAARPPRCVPANAPGTSSRRIRATPTSRCASNASASSGTSATTASSPTTRWRCAAGRTRCSTPSELFNVTISGPSGHTTTIVELIRLDDHRPGLRPRTGGRCCSPGSLRCPARCRPARSPSPEPVRWRRRVE